MTATEWLVATALTLAPPAAHRPVRDFAEVLPVLGLNLTADGRTQLTPWQQDDPQVSIRYFQLWRATGLINDLQALDRLADSYGQLGDHDQEVMALEELVCRLGGGSDTEFERLRLAGAYRAAGREADGLALLTELATEEGPNPVEPADLTGVQNFARETLADYHFARKEWKASLRWYEGATVRGCQTGLQERKGFRAARIATCRKELGMPAK